MDEQQILEQFEQQRLKEISELLQEGKSFVDGELIFDKDIKKELSDMGVIVQIKNNKLQYLVL